MKIVAWTLGTLLGISAIFGIAQYLASERVEVVVLHTHTKDSETRETRLWIVEHHGFQYLRAGSPTSTWYAQIRDNPDIAVERDGKRRQYVAVPRIDKRNLVNRLMRRKYTWGDQFISLMIQRSEAIPIELHPIKE